MMTAIVISVKEIRKPKNVTHLLEIQTPSSSVPSCLTLEEFSKPYNPKLMSKRRAEMKE